MKNTIINKFIKLGLTCAMVTALMSCNNPTGNTAETTVEKDPETIKKEKSVDNGPFAIGDYKFKNLEDAIVAATENDLIFLTEDISIPAEKYNLQSKGLVGLVLNNKTLTVTNNNNKELSFYNGTLAIFGTLEDESSSGTIILEEGVGDISFNIGTFVMVNMDIKSSAYGIRTNQALFLSLNLKAETRRDCVIAKDSGHCYMGKNTSLKSETGKSISYITDYINKDKLELYRQYQDTIKIEDCYDYSSYDESENFIPVEYMGVSISDGIYSNITFGKYITKLLGDELTLVAVSDDGTTLVTTDTNALLELLGLSDQQ